eukprot:TRINITY_DN45798_c0_g1_i1.p1 TRINITY_DN45798_c0_g1~~TRINITY_DN45798_c0_g1_i1.p1  ORF type:complete len:199 (+),score=39.32 TRINITY_DN45798_c0_g1_i1:98-694(+)
MPSEPTQKDIEEYAERIGMDLQNDHDLLWIAHQGLTKTTPSSWKVCQTGPGTMCYFNYQTGETALDCDDVHAKIYKRCKAQKEQGLVLEAPPPVMAEKPAQARKDLKEPPRASTDDPDPEELEKSAGLVLEAFKTSDVQGNGSISKQKLDRLFKMIDAESGIMDDAQIQKLLDILGKDGYISYPDLVNWVFFPGKQAT